MLCPLKKSENGARQAYFEKCDREKCAWWVMGPVVDPEIGRCAVLDIAFSLGEFLASGLPVNNHF